MTKPVYHNDNGSFVTDGYVTWYQMACCRRATWTIETSRKQ